MWRRGVFVVRITVSVPRVVVEPRASEHGQLIQILVLDRPARDQPALGKEDRDVAGARCRRRQRADELRIAIGFDLIRLLKRFCRTISVSPLRARDFRRRPEHG